MGDIVESEVGDIARTAGDEPLVLEARQPLADETVRTMRRRRRGAFGT
jgi:hypothetical protein